MEQIKLTRTNGMVVDYYTKQDLNKVEIEKDHAIVTIKPFKDETKITYHVTLECGKDLENLLK